MQSGQCIKCGRSDSEAPLLQFLFKQANGWICSICLPTLIHHPEQLEKNLPGAGQIVPQKKVKPQGADQA